jgi:hypothetical protein
VHCIHALRDGERVEDIIDPESIPAHVERENFDESAFYPMTHELKEVLDAARAA